MRSESDARLAVLGAAVRMLRIQLESGMSTPQYVIEQAQGYIDSEKGCLELYRAQLAEIQAEARRRLIRPV
jgi:hypothetical protein